MDKSKIVKRIETEIIEPYKHIGYTEDDYTLFSFGSCNTKDSRDVSDIDMTLLFEKEYLVKKTDKNNPDSPTYWDMIRQKMQKIEKEFPGELHLHIGDFSFIDGYSPKAALPSHGYNSNEGWGNLAKHYRLFYNVVSGKTESGRKEMEKLRLNPQIYNIPRHEGEELFMACKRDMAQSFLNGILAKESNNVLELKKASNAMAKSLLRGTEAYRLRLGCSPSWDEKERSVYIPIVRNGKVILEEVTDSLKILEQALEMKLSGGDFYEFDSTTLDGFIRLFDNLKEQFSAEIRIEKDFMPKESCDELKQYSVYTGQIVFDSLTERLDQTKLWPVLFIAGEELMSYLESEYTGKGILEESKQDKLDKLYNIISNFRKLTHDLDQTNGLPENKFCSMLYGRISLLKKDYLNSEIYLEKTLDSEETFGFSQSYHSVLLKRLAEAKINLGTLDKKEEAKKLIEEAVKLDPLDAETWSLLAMVDNDNDSKAISISLLKTENQLEEILSNKDISLAGVKRFFMTWNDYVSDNLSIELNRLEYYSSELDDGINNFVIENNGLYSRAINNLSKKESELFKGLIKTTTDYLNKISEGRIVIEKRYIQFLKLRWETYKSIMDIESIIQGIHNAENDLNTDHNSTVIRSTKNVIGDDNVDQN